MNRFTKLLYTTIALTVLVALPAGAAFADEYPLMAGQNIEVGTVTVSDDGTDLTVKYAISPQSILEGWVIVKAHMYADIKKPKKGAPGRFPFHSGSASRSRTWCWATARIRTRRRNWPTSSRRRPIRS